MSTEWQYSPVSSQDVDLISRTKQSDSTESVGSPEDKQENLQSNREDDIKLYESTTQTFTNVDVGDILQIPNWPGPQTLEVTRGESMLHRMGYALLLLPPLFFLLLVLSAIGLHSHMTNRFGVFVGQACLLGPTVFPLAFSAVLGWCLTTYGRYQSERGVKLGLLERGIGSQTVFSFLRFAFAFKRLDRLCIVLGLLWSLSPLGGQGILRMLSIRQADQESKETINYLDLYDGSQYRAADIELTRNVVNALYLASLYAPMEVQNRTTDLWGAVKIPSIESLDFDHQDDDGVPVKDVLSYISLLGIPISSTAYKNASSYSFTLDAVAFTTQCDEPKIFRVDDVLPDNSTTFSLETHIFGSETDKDLQRNITLMTYPYQATMSVVHHCRITPNFLLVKVECYSGHCGVSRIKKVAYRIDRTTNAMFGGLHTWPNIMKALPTSTGKPKPGVSSQTERYLYSPQKARANNPLSIPDLSKVPIREFNRRLATILNTYYQATISPTLRLGSFDLNTAYTIGAFRTTEATIRIPRPTYQRHWEWVISAFVASFAMLSVAMTGILLEKQVITPDIYGYVSSMTRDNPHFPLPPTGCTLEGTKRAVLLNDVFVRFEDVSPDKKIGHLAFTMAGYKTPTEQSIDCRLRRTKIYSGSS
ncbi:hypothetical protein CPB86DRAFT_788341 [Serendipita vermifera]|nr:hypothetical protein CPB86DRAFT_788341 [Serendipita vermifera]